MLKKIKIKRKRGKGQFFKTSLSIFVASFLILFILNIVFSDFSWFNKKFIINPIVKNSHDIAKISKLLIDHNIQFLSINLISDYLEVKLKDESSIYISLKKDVQVQISSLQAILKQLTINGKKFSQIDFRFDKPVIKYKN